MNVHELNVDVKAYKLGQESTKSFLLAGERNIVSKFSRKGTDEEKFRSFFNELSAGNQALVQSYFKKQGNLSLPQRTKILGNYTELKIDDELTLHTSAKLLEKTGASNNLNSMFSTLKALSMAKSKVEKSTTRSNKGKYTKLSMKLNWVEVIKAEDRDQKKFHPFKKKIWKTDEGILSVITIDETGDVTKKSIYLGQMWEKSERKDKDKKKDGRYEFNGKKLSTVNLKEGGNNFPKTYNFQIIAIERDRNKDWENFIDAIASYAKRKITEELIAAGIIKGGQKIGIPIPPQIARIIASFVKGFVDKIIDWAVNLLRNNDDIIGSRTFTYTVNNYNHHKVSLTRDFIGSGGHWRMKYTFEKE